MSKSKLGSWLLWGSVFAAMTPVHAAEVLSKEETPLMLEAVVVEDDVSDDAVVEKQATLGVLGGLPVIEAPYSISVVNQHLLEIQQSTRYTDYLKNVTGANVGNVTIGFFSLRGFSVGTDGYLYDGLPGHVALSETYQIDSFDRIEVMKGPSTFLNGFGGASSLGGTLNYVPKRAGDEPFNSMEVDYTNRALFSVGADTGQRFGQDQQFGYRLNARYRDGEQQAEDYDWTQKAASLALDWRASRDLSFALHFEYADNHLPELPPFFIVAPGVQVPDAPDTRRNIAQSWDDFRTVGRSAYLRSDWNFAQGWTLTTQALNGETRRPYLKGARFGFINDTAGNATLFGFESGSEIDSDSVQALIRGHFATGAVRHRLTTGISFLSNHSSSANVGSTGAFPTNLYNPVDGPEPAFVGAPMLPSSKSHSSSLLVSDILDFSELWTLLLAARHAKFSLDNYTAEGTPKISKTTPTAALMFKPVSGSLLYINYSQGIEQGGIAPLGTINQNQQLAPLVTEQYEVGAKLERQGITYAVAIFDLSKPSEFTDSTGRFVQEGLQRHQGLEITATGELLPRLNVVTGATFLDPKAEKTGNTATDGKRPVSVPRFSTNLFADYGINAVPGLYINAGVYHNAKQYLDSANTQELKGWTRLDAGARYETAFGRTLARFALGIENLANEDYWIGQSGILTVADPLTLKLSARFDL